MNKTYSRKETAKKIGVTVVALKELEASGVVVPIRDERRRIRYTPEAIEAVRPFLASMGPPAMVAAPPPSEPLPVQVMPAPRTPTFHEPTPEALPSIAGFGYAPEPTSASPVDTAALGVRLREAISFDLALQGMTLEAWVAAWARTGNTPPLPSTAGSVVAAFAASQGLPIDEAWAGIWSAMAEGIRDQLAPFQGAAPQWSSPPSCACPAPPPAYVPYRSSQPTRQPVYRPQTVFTMPGTYNATQFPGLFTSQVPEAVRDARAAVEIQRAEIERRRLERQMEDEAEARQRAEQAQEVHELEVVRQRAIAEKMAERELQTRAQADYLAAQRAAEAARAAEARVREERHLQGQLADKQHREAMRQSEIAHMQRIEAEAAAQMIAGILSTLPPEMPLEDVEQIRTQVGAAIEGKPTNAAVTLTRDIVGRAAAPYVAAREVIARRQEVMHWATVAERCFYSSLGPEAEAAAEAAVRELVNATDVNGGNFHTVMVTARRVRDQALEPYRAAAKAEERAKLLETLFANKRYWARSRAIEHLKQAGADAPEGQADAVVDAAEERVRATSFDLSLNPFAFDDAVEKTLFAAIADLAGGGA